MPFYRTNKPTKWNLDRIRQGFELALLGATDEEMARVMGISIHTLNDWKRTYPKFLQTIEDGKLSADSKAAAGLFKRACGFEQMEIVVHMYRGEVIQTPVMKYYPPDPWSANKWLAVRQRTRWSEVQRIETTQTTININKFDFNGLSNEELMFAKNIGMKQLLAHDDNQN